MNHPSTLITGAAGFAGRHLLAHLQGSHPAARLVAWSHRDVDVTDRDAVTKGIITVRPDRVVHLAGSPAVYPD